MNFFFATSVILAANVASAQLATRHRRHRRGLAGTNDAAFDQEAGMSMPSDLSMSMDLSLDAITGGTLQEKPDYLVSMVKCPQGASCLNSHDCSGVLIAPNVLLTSAGCVVGQDGWADFFREDISEGAKRNGIVRYYFGAEDVVVSEDFGSGFLDSIALVFLRLPAPSGTKIMKLSQRVGAPDVEDALNVVGWDLDGTGTATQDQDAPILSSTLSVSYLTNEECSAEIERGGVLLTDPPSITDKQLCANAEPGQGTCRNDGGSPLIRDGKYVEGILARPLTRQDPPRTKISIYFPFQEWNLTSIIPVLLQEEEVQEEVIVLARAVENIARSVFSDEISRGLLGERAIVFSPFPPPNNGPPGPPGPPDLFVQFVEPCVYGNCTLQEEESTLAKDAEESLESNFRALLTAEAEACEVNCIGLSSALGVYPGDDDVISSPDISFVPEPAGEEPCAIEFPSIYTRISSYNSWIKKTICERTGEFCKKSSKASK